VSRVPPSRAARRGRPSRGFTLIELLIAAALLAVLAVLSWRGLDAVLEARRQIVSASDELRALMVAFAQIDEDLRRSWPVRLQRLQQPSIGFTVAGEQASATLELLRESTGALEPTTLQRVAWRLREGRIERGFGVWSATPAVGFDASASARAASGFEPVVAGNATTGERGGLIWQPVLVGVAQLQMQGWVDGQGWIAAEALAGQLRGSALEQPGQTDPTAQVTGLLVRVVRADGRVLQRIFPVKD
jgi:general secretion pathway protein J